ncbi:MAG TPA: M14 family zinc carboxypeptidase [Longimicrobiales bacterium]|nr:M14 family zinc carboxypeptidase [Longimicrobiales bacterium]
MPHRPRPTPLRRRPTPALRRAWSRLAAAVAAAVLVAAGDAAAQQAPVVPAAPMTDEPLPAFVPGTAYDPGIPTLESVVGHGIRDEITSPAEMAVYFRSLAAAAPDRTRLVEYGETWEGRPLLALLVGSPANMARLDDVQAGLRRLADPRGLGEGEVDDLVADLPVLVSLVHGIHGNEISSAGAAMAMAYHLLAARDEPRAATILANAVVLIDPAQNPDGRARFVLGTRQGRGRWADPHPLSAEHDEPFPGGRTNHYLFDLNRDWFAQTQMESRARAALLLAWPSQVVVDVHEMGGNSTYYFPPNAVPGNPWTTDEQNAALRRAGAAMAANFDARGFRYFNRDTYDAFYPGYGVSWPMALGAIGMTFEQASARGMVLRRADGSLLTYGDGVLHHFTATFATTEWAATERERLLREFVEFRRSGAALGEGRAYVLHSAHDPAMARRLAETLVRNGIEVTRPAEALEVDGRTLDARSTFVVPLAQPSHRLIRNMLDRQTSMDTTFVEEQIRRRSLRLRDQIYDVTAWNLPMLWDVELLDGPAALAEGGARVTLEEAPSRPAVGEAGVVAWLMPWGGGTAALVADLLRDGATVRATGAELVLHGRTFPVGTAIVRPSENPGLAAALAGAAARHGVEVVPVASAYTDSGSSLGSNATRTLRLPRILLAWDRPGSTYSVGWARYVLEQRYGLPVTAVRGQSLGGVRLSDFDVVVLPSGNYGGVLGDAGVDRLRAWMAEGGTLVTMAESSRWAGRAGLLATTTELRGGAPESGGGEGGGGVSEQPIDPVASLAPAREAPEPVPGAILNVDLDTSHWLAAGTDGRVGALVEGSRVFTPLTLDEGVNVGRYAGVDELVASGIAWEESRPQLAHKAFLMHQPVGSGQLVAFAEDPNYRAYAEAAQLLLLNAVLLGPGR